VDLNSDKLNDIIASCKTSNGDYKISYYIYNEKTKIFEFSDKYNKNPLIISDYEIISFLANDLNKDGYLDYVMTLKKNKKYESRIYLYNKDGGTYELIFKSNNDELTQNLFVADIGSIRILKIIYYDNTTKMRKVFYFDELENKFITKNFTEFLSKNTKVCDGNGKYANMPFEIPNSNAFVDIDGDCLNDIIISNYDNTNKKRLLEIWKGVFEDNEVKYCLSMNNVYEVDNSLGLFTIVDVDRNALPDIVFPILNSSPPQILVAFNILSMSYVWTRDYCDDHPPINLSKSPNSKINKIFENFNIKTSNKNNYIMNIHNNKNFMFYSDNTDFPLILRFIDVNQDSYPDFVTILYDKSTKKKNLFIFLSQEIEKGENKDRRFFNQNSIYNLTSNYETNYDIIVSSFFDFEDQRKMGLILYDSNGVSLGLYNNYIYDTYTLKSTLLFKKDCFFCTEYGSSQRFITTNINGDRRMDLSLQTPQINVPGILSLTYAYLGIGRSNNYIENFHIISGNAYKRSDNDKTYTPVIPNSQLVIYHDNIANSNSTTWEVDLVVKPTKYLYELIIVIIIVVILMTFISIRLLSKEREEDYMENKETFAPWFG
jgi:integrin alpha FG-GAP repeat containing protein 1